jgi:RNA polymerase sigma-70 factor (ECF subfamily)
MSKRRNKRIEKEIAALAASQDADIDTSDIPEVTDWNAAIRGRFDRLHNKRVIVLLHDSGSKRRLRAWFAAWIADLAALWPPSRPGRGEPDRGPAMSTRKRYDRIAEPELRAKYSGRSSPRKRVDFYQFDADYVRRLKNRDPATEAHFLSYFSPRLQLKLRHRGFVSPALEDVSQEAFLRVLTALQGGTVLHPEKFSAYVNAVCDKVLLEAYREPARDRHLDLAGVDLAAGETNPETMLPHEGQRRLVDEILSQLSVKKRNILRALIFERLSQDEMCARFGIKPDHLRVVLSRAKEEFGARARVFISGRDEKSGRIKHG